MAEAQGSNAAATERHRLRGDGVSSYAQTDASELQTEDTGRLGLRWSRRHERTVQAHQRPGDEQDQRAQRTVEERGATTTITTNKDEHLRLRTSRNATSTADLFGGLRRSRGSFFTGADEYGRTEDEREEGETFWADD